MDQATRDAFHEDGAVIIRGLLNEEQLSMCREAFDWAIANPGPHATSLFNGTEQQSHVDNSNPKAKPKLDELVATLPFGQLFSELWGSEQVWYFAEEVFMKLGGIGSPTFWHQDTSYLPWAGSHWGNAWISFESVPKANSLSIVKGSHRGPRYDGTTFRDPDNPTEPLHGGGALPRLPDVDAELAKNPDAFDILSWATNPGDVVVVHPGSLHGGARVDEAFPDRHTLVFRFFGDDATFQPLPAFSENGVGGGGQLFSEEMATLKAGEPFRHKIFRKIHG